MKFSKIRGLVLVGMFCVALMSCSDNPASSVATSGNVKISIKSISTGQSSQGVVLDKSVSAVTITSAFVVIERIRFDSSIDDTLDFRLNQPFVQDLMVGSNLHVIETVEVPFGSYKKIRLKIDELDPEDGAAYNQNPALQEVSILVSGYLDGDPNETFVFKSDLDEEQEREFEPPFILDETSASTNVVFTLNMDVWFLDNNGNFLDPRFSSNEGMIEDNIKDSIDAFEDKDDDGEKDED